MGEVTARQAGILRLVVREYIETAAPVGSKMIRDKYALPTSPATIRSEMQVLEEEGLLTHPHTSAGRVPSDRGYRVYVESLMDPADLTAEEKATLRYQFYQAAPELDEWAELAAVLLARSLGLLAVVAPPRARELRVRHVELIALKDLLALLVVVLHEARVLKQLVTLDSALDQAALSVVAAQLNQRMEGKSVRELRLLPATEVGAPATLDSALVHLLEEAQLREAEARVQGLRAVLEQPEFQDDHGDFLKIMTLLDQHAIDRVLPTGALIGNGVSVVIGGENQSEAMRRCSVVVAPYGIGSEVAGFVGLVGPTRMRYGRAVASVRYYSDLLRELMGEVYG